jgi:BREX system ATP-binding protein BrxC/D
VDSVQARRVIESLRKGIPPDGFVRHFTVGRESEIRRLTNQLSKPIAGALLLKANYGSGKTHLLKFIREHALENSFAVSSVTLDARGAVRFNRMDQIFGAICRNIEVPGTSDAKGIRPFFNLLGRQINERDGWEFWSELSNQSKWDYSETLESPAVFVGFRAWLTGEPDVMDLVEDWFFQSWQYRGQRKKLYHELVDKLRKFFRDPRPEYKFYADEIFMFHTQGHSQSWSALRDLHLLAQKGGLRGLIILFDEFEDVITNLGNVAHEEAAFWNLFQFYSGNWFPGMTFYAVTPEFVQKCIMRLTQKRKYDFDFSRLVGIPTFEMSPLETADLTELAQRIVSVHGKAYSWDAKRAINKGRMDQILLDATAVQIQDRTRYAIISVVKALDDSFHDLR